MWFKNLQVYRFTKDFDLSAEQLAAALEATAFTPCGSQDPSRYGWVPPIGRLANGEEGEEYVHSANGYMMICAKREDKILPAAVVNEQMELQVQLIQQEQGRGVGRKERQTLKEEITFSLLPRAFSKSSKHFAYIAPKEGLLIIDASSASRAEDLMNCLRDSIDSLPVIPLTAKNMPQQVMTDWLKNGEVASGFSLGHECELRDPSDEAGVIRCKHQELDSVDINNHIKSGMYVSKLGLCWDSGVECVIDDTLAIKRLSFGDIVQEKAGQIDTDSAAEQFDVDFSIMTLTLSGFISALTTAFGGENTAEAEAASL